jgi:hypothetical protein
MIIIREHVHIGPHVVHHYSEPLKQGIDGLTMEMSEVLVLSPVSRIHLSLNLGISNMSFLQHRLDSTSQALRVHPTEFKLTQSTEQVVDRFVVGVEHVPRCWSKEVHQLAACFALVSCLCINHCRLATFMIALWSCIPILLSFV